MKKYFIEDVKCGCSDGGMACGPVDGSEIVSILYRTDSGEKNWISLAQTMGALTFILGPDDIYDNLIEDGSWDDAMYDYVDSHTIHSLDGVNLDEYEYDYPVDEFKEDPDCPAEKLIVLMIALTQCELDEIEDLDKMVEAMKGKDLSEIEIPLPEYDDDDEY